jgi:hypothetical protein
MNSKNGRTMQKVSMTLLFLALGCDAKDQVVAKETSPVTAAQVQVAVNDTSAKLSVTTPDGKSTSFMTMLAWNLDFGANKAPQVAFFTEPATCEDRLDNSKTKFYAAFMGDLEPNEINALAEGDPYSAPNWGYTGLPEFIPGSEDEQTYPPLHWGKVVVTKADAKTVEGTVDFESKGVVVRGEFVAERCPDM